MQIEQTEPKGYPTAYTGTPRGEVCSKCETQRKKASASADAFLVYKNGLFRFARSAPLTTPYNSVICSPGASSSFKYAPRAGMFLVL